MMSPERVPKGNPAREAIASLGGYVYQLYQSALAWTELKGDELLYLEVAEDYAVAAKNKLKAVQVKETAKHVTINSDEIVASIDSFVELQESNLNVKVYLRHLTTAKIGKEKRNDHRIGSMPTLISWRKLARIGELSDLRKILDVSKISEKSKNFIADLDDADFREQFLKRIHFDCGAPDSLSLSRQLHNWVSEKLIKKGGVRSQVADCIAAILFTVLNLSTNSNRNERSVDRDGLEELLEKFTHITVNRAQFEEQSRLVTKVTSDIVSSSTSLLSSRIVNLSLVSEVPLPKALANRDEQITKLLQSLESFGICWISGAAGMGKTVAARVLAHKNEGDWANINLRGQSCEQIAKVLAETVNALPTLGLRGLIVDDLDYVMEPMVHENLHHLFYSSNRLDMLLIVTSFNRPTSEFLFASNLQSDIAITLTEFTEGDIKEILEKIGVSCSHWAKYAYLVSGGGHPQLAIAFIQSMAAYGWNPEEFQTFDALLSGSPAVNEVRKRIRERLLSDLPDSGRRLIERLSLMVGGFSRELAVDLGKVVPSIPDAGIVMDMLVGSWIDQLDGDRFNLSPLLSNFASNTLARKEREKIQCAIADSLTKGPCLNPTDMDSAMLAAWSGKNETVIRKICIAVLGSNQDEIEMLAPLLSFFTYSTTDAFEYSANAEINHMFRGVQVLILNQRSGSAPELQKALAYFARAAGSVEHSATRATMNLLVYSKLLLQISKAKLGTKFIKIFSKLDQLLDQLLENKDEVIPSEALESMKEIGKNGVAVIGFMFLNQARQLTKIEELTAVFNFLDGSTPEQRTRFLAPFKNENFGADMLVNGAWLYEHNNESIESEAHSAVFAQLERQAASWKSTDLAVCCRMFQAVILDEYGNDKEGALAVLDECLDQYGPTNSKLVRAKARVLYRSGNYEKCLALSKLLIESDAPFSEVEKAFLCREAAISAEKEGDLGMARRYYLFGREAAKKPNLPNMSVMGVGLLADAALASWKDGDRFICLRNFFVVLSELNNLKPEETLCTAHCHAATRHALLWVEQDAIGKKHLFDDGEETEIYPGFVSNPEPHPDIGARFVPPIELAWYMLARIENYAALDTGITESLNRFLPKGPVIEGQFLLGPAKMHKALATLNKKLFVESLKENISKLAFIQTDGGSQNSFDSKNVTYSSIPSASKEQQFALCEPAEQFVLLFCANCVFRGAIAEIISVIKEITGASGFSIRSELLDRLQRVGPATDFYTNFAQIVHRESLAATFEPHGPSRQVFELAFSSLQMARHRGVCKLYAENILPWLEQRWKFVWEQQRFLLHYPLLHEASIKTAFGRKGISAQTKIAGILTAILPTLRIATQQKLSRDLSDLSRQ